MKNFFNIIHSFAIIVRFINESSIYYYGLTLLLYMFKFQFSKIGY